MLLDHFLARLTSIDHGGRGDQTRRRFRSTLDHTLRHRQALAEKSESELRELTSALSREAASGKQRGDFVALSVALIADAVRRVHRLEAYEVQLLAGIVLAEGELAEMATGEGKTLVALMPAFAFGLAGHGAHVATVNPYLAERDCEFARPIFALLGKTVALLPERALTSRKREAYAADVTYGVGTEFGFDYLRDQIALRNHRLAFGHPRFHDLLLGRTPPPPDLAQRGHAFAVIDEADSVLIDEASSPLIISLGNRRPSSTPQVYRRANEIAEQLTAGQDFVRDRESHRLVLTQPGRERIFAALDDETLAQLRRQWPHYVEMALRARFDFRRDVHFVVTDDRVISVDEYTGRLCPDRTWREGLHQAVEARSGVTITEENQSAATITRPAYFRLYRTICGLTGTGQEAAAEMKESYALATRVIPLHRPSARDILPDRVFTTREAKHAAVVADVAERRSRQQPVLIGSRTIENSESVAQALNAAGIPYRLLNAKQDAEEAQIIAQAGVPGMVTIATNMAGRGAHIPVPEESRQAGGLHVIGLERHESARIDRQLVGRGARQGQPGGAQFFLSLEDDLLRRHSPSSVERLRKLQPNANGELPARAAATFRRVQRRVETHAVYARRMLKRYDEWLAELKEAF